MATRWMALAERVAGLTCIGPQAQVRWTPDEHENMVRAWEAYGATGLRRMLCGLALFAALMSIALEAS